MNMKFNQFLVAAKNAKQRMTEGKILSFKELLEEEFAKAHPQGDGIDSAVNGEEFGITEEEMDVIFAEIEKSPRVAEALKLHDEEINEAETFDLKTFLVKTANYMKASAGIEAAVDALYKAKIDLVKKETAFEDKWPAYTKQAEDKIKAAYKAKIDAADSKKKPGLRADRNAKLSELEDKLKDVKAAKLKQFKQSGEDKVTAAQDRIKKLEQPEGGLPDFATTIISGLRKTAENEGEVRLAEEKYKDNEEKLKKVQARLDKKAKEDAQDIQSDMQKAESKMSAAQSRAGDDIRNEKPQDSAIDEKDTEKFEDGKELFAQAHEGMGEVKAAFSKVKGELSAYLQASDAYDNAAESDKDKAEDARNDAKANYDAAKGDFKTAKSSAGAAVEQAISWCNKNASSTQSDIKSLAGQKSSFETMKEALDSLEISDDSES